MAEWGVAPVLRGGIGALNGMAGGRCGGSIRQEC